MSEFQREDRYIVIKRSDLDKLPAHLRGNFLGRCRSLHAQMFNVGAPARSFVVVEQDWPEYHLVWAMLEHRMAGKPVPDFNLWRRANELQERLNVADQRVDDLETELERLKAGYKWESERAALLLNELQDSEREAGSQQPGAAGQCQFPQSCTTRCDCDIPDFSPGNGNKARRRAEALKPTESGASE